MRGNSTLEDETYYIEGKTQILSVPSFFLLLLKRTCMLNIPQKNLKPENQTTGWQKINTNNGSNFYTIFLKIQRYLIRSLFEMHLKSLRFSKKWFKWFHCDNVKQEFFHPPHFGEFCDLIFCLGCMPVVLAIKTFFFGFLVFF